MCLPTTIPVWGDRSACRHPPTLDRRTSSRGTDELVSRHSQIQSRSSDIAPPADPVPVAETTALDDALVHSQDAKEKVVAVADALGTTNHQVRSLMSKGADVLPAKESLAQNEQIESNVKEVADDLDQVNDALAQGVEHLQAMGEALNQTEARLVVSEQDAKAARDRSLHDAATGLPSRALFEDRLTHAISMAERHAWTLAVLFLDLDRFKAVNDTFGHAAGDVVLQQVARRLEHHSRDEDTVCRYGGDEFLLLLVDPKGRDNVETIARAITASIAEPIDVGGAQVCVGASVGTAYYPDDGWTCAQLVAAADTAMYACKRRGRT
jgi:diguanylate cyclase (GGDEF)-like protein